MNRLLLFSRSRRIGSTPVASPVRLSFRLFGCCSSSSIACVARRAAFRLSSTTAAAAAATTTTTTTTVGITARCFVTSTVMSSPSPSPTPTDPSSDAHPDFVGLPRLITKHARQLTDFEHWAATKQWVAMHAAHYDWWMFPTDKPSQHGFSYTVSPGVFRELKADPEFMRRFRRGVELLARGWGWDVHNQKPVPKTELSDGQRWMVCVVCVKCCVLCWWRLTYLSLYIS